MKGIIEVAFDDKYRLELEMEDAFLDGSNVLSVIYTSMSILSISSLHDHFQRSLIFLFHLPSFTGCLLYVQKFTETEAAPPHH